MIHLNALFLFIYLFIFLCFKTIVACCHLTFVALNFEVNSFFFFVTYCPKPYRDPFTPFSKKKKKRKNYINIKGPDHICKLEGDSNWYWPQVPAMELNHWNGWERKLFQKQMLTKGPISKWWFIKSFCVVKVKREGLT